MKLILGFIVLAAAVPLLCGLRGGKFSNRPLMIFFDMDFQPRYRAQGESQFFSDGSAQRQPPAGTIAFGGNDYFSDAGRVRQDERLWQADETFYRGKQREDWVKTAPVELSMPRLRDGQEYYETLCAVCHGRTGGGNGIMKGSTGGMDGSTTASSEARAASGACSRRRRKGGEAEAKNSGEDNASPVREPTGE